MEHKWSEGSWKGRGPVKQPVEYNFKSAEEMKARDLNHHLEGEQPGLSVFLKRGEEIYHTYSCYGRGLDHLLTTYQLLDLTPLGRQDSGDSSVGGGLGFKYHDEY